MDCNFTFTGSKLYILKNNFKIREKNDRKSKNKKVKRKQKCFLLMIRIWMKSKMLQSQVLLFLTILPPSVLVKKNHIYLNKKNLKSKFQV
jgi:hypothetical protein